MERDNRRGAGTWAACSALTTRKRLLFGFSEGLIWLLTRTSTAGIIALRWGNLINPAGENCYFEPKGRHLLLMMRMDAEFDTFAHIATPARGKPSYQPRLFRKCHICRV